MTKKSSQKTNITILLCWYFYRFIITRRYKIDIKGVELLQAEGGKLILPNHQSHMDPQIMALETYRHGSVVPVVAERFFRIPAIKYFLKEWGAVSVRDIKGGNIDAKVLQTITEQVKEALIRGKNVIIYPSGQLTDQGIEKIHNKQGAFALVADLPENVRVLGVRINGLWGSMWSKAWEGKQPNFLTTFLKGIFLLTANLIFFSPKRKVSLEFVDITSDAIKHSKHDRKTFNTFLENFFNKNGREEVTYVRHYFFLPASRRTLPENLKKKVDDKVE